MRIAIFGTNAASDCLIKLLLKDPTVTKVIHFGANSSTVGSDRYELLREYELDPAIRKENLLAKIRELDVDLIIPMNLHFQTWPEFQMAIRSKNIPVLGPRYNAAFLEWSKVISKNLFNYIGIPSPKYVIYPADELQKDFLDIERPFVLKYDRDYRAGFETIIVTDDNVDQEYAEFKTNGKTRYLKMMGDFVDQKMIIEDYIPSGREYSYHALCNNTGFTYIGSARDYKKLEEGDIGPNTAGVGSYAPATDVDQVVHTYVQKLLDHFKQRNNEYIGFLYLGIIVDQTGIPLVLEINTRPGDPELQCLLPLIKNNIANLLYTTASDQQLPVIDFSDKFSVSVRIFNKNYKLNTKQEREPELGTIPNNISISYNSDRELLYAVLTAEADSIEEASNIIYNFLKDKDLGDYTYRKDIGKLL